MGNAYNCIKENCCPKEEEKKDPDLNINKNTHLIEDCDYKEKNKEFFKLIFFYTYYILYQWNLKVKWYKKRS